mmetsp:Transcript_54332/g.116699  ORF Transcript_54332/g.116699 Transcript_54332/m.116699 type:complete len:85 (-) Transcript_54332:19-273(-)
MLLAAGCARCRWYAAPLFERSERLRWCTYRDCFMQFVVQVWLRDRAMFKSGNHLDAVPGTSRVRVQRFGPQFAMPFSSPFPMVR